ncbi:helix-turn-helix domain-containing protein [Streptomyces sp. NBC_00057]|uniref:helix-turn-helix domain-containing protein n=1 Tax=Streptomyces sp. NBC_00057 TaxID=2975634 RepID=UPI0032506EE6
MTTEHRITDPVALKALAHPTRRQLLRLLSQLGPSTATRLAQHTGLDPGLVSYHLRELARRGFIEVAEELARDRRERWWRVPATSTSWSTLDFREPDSRTVANTVKAHMVAEEFERLKLFENERDSWGERWQKSATSSESHLHLTPEELGTVAAELSKVLEHWREISRQRMGAHPPADQRSGTAGSDGTGLEHVFVFFHAFPEHP